MAGGWAGYRAAHELHRHRHRRASPVGCTRIVNAVSACPSEAEMIATGTLSSIGAAHLLRYAGGSQPDRIPCSWARARVRRTRRSR
jgi:hypothetical protein